MKPRTYCLDCREHTDNIVSRVTMRNKVIIDKSRCAECLSDKSRFMKQEHDEKSGNNKKSGHSKKSGQ